MRCVLYIIFKVLKGGFVMNIYVEIIDGIMNKYFYVFVEFKGFILMLYSF